MKYSRVGIVTEYVDVLHSRSCKAPISKPTRITKQSSTLIDHTEYVLMIQSMTFWMGSGALPRVGQGGTIPGRHIIAGGAK